ncbi:MAG: phosphatidylcholine synthase, partial [Rhodobacterales bacterium 12-65-15]
AGFPACWNMVVLVLFATRPGEMVILFVVILLSVAMFTSLKFVHPTRTPRWHEASLAACILWIALAAWAAWMDFQIGPLTQWALVLCSLYLCLAGIVQQVVPVGIRRVR